MRVDFRSCFEARFVVAVVETSRSRPSINFNRVDRHCGHLTLSVTTLSLTAVTSLLSISENHRFLVNDWTTFLIEASLFCPRVAQTPVSFFYFSRTPRSLK
jgi:hypothetical protein